MKNLLIKWVKFKQTNVEIVQPKKLLVDNQDVMLKINLEKMRGADEAEPEPGSCDT